MTSVRLAFLGPVLGRHEGWVTTQGEVLAGLFADDGHEVRTSSGRISPIGRAVDHAVDLVRWRRRIDVVVVSVFSGRAFALADEGLSLARALGLPTVAWLHGGALPEFGPGHPRWVRRVLGGADAVVAPTPFLARWARGAAGGVDVDVVPNVLDLSASPFRDRTPPRPRLLWMRTFQELYDPQLAVQTLAELRRRGTDAALTMAGQDKGALDATRREAVDLGVERWITFPGFASGPAKAALLADHDVFLNTNRVDNAPVTVLEAAASGLAVVSTAVGGLPDLLPDDDAALLVPEGDPIAMSDAVERVLDDPDLAGRLTTSARQVAERSGWPTVRDAWLDVLDRVAPGAGTP